MYGIIPKFPIVSLELLQRGHSCARGLEPPKGGFFSLRTFPGTILFCSRAAALLGFHTLLPKWSKMWIIPCPEKLSAPLGCFPAGIEIKTELMSILSSASSLQRVGDVYPTILVQFEVISVLLEISTGLGWNYSCHWAGLWKTFRNVTKPEFLQDKDLWIRKMSCWAELIN